MIKVDQRNKSKRKTTQLIIFLVLFLNFGFIVSSFLSSVSIGEIKRGKKSQSQVSKKLKNNLQHPAGSVQTSTKQDNHNKIQNTGHNWISKCLFTALWCS